MIKNISVLGAGTMGHGIALAFARFGYHTKLYDNNAEYLKTVPPIISDEFIQMARAGLIEETTSEEVLSNIELSFTLESAVSDADFIIEATPEILNLKQQIFGAIDKLCGPDTVFASNTSSLRLSDVIEHLPESRKKRSLIAHWFNPPHIIPLVELSKYGNQDEDSFEEVFKLFLSIEKKPIRVREEVPGLVSNRLQNALAREAFHLIEQGICDPEDINTAITYGGTAFRLSVAGLTEIVDMGGIDIWTSVADNLWGDLSDSHAANKFLKDFVEEGKLGLKSGQGFSSYPEDRRAAMKEDFNSRLMKHLKEIAGCNYFAPLS